MSVQISGFEILRANLEGIATRLKGQAVEEALQAGAEVFKTAIESRTPHGKTGKLAGSVIIHKRAVRGLSASVDEIVLLIGYEKKKGYYGYFYDQGRAGQQARPFAESAFNSAVDSALARATLIVTAYIEGNK